MFKVFIQDTRTGHVEELAVSHLDIQHNHGRLSGFEWAVTPTRFEYSMRGIGIGAPAEKQLMELMRPAEEVEIEQPAEDRMALLDRLLATFKKEKP